MNLFENLQLMKESNNQIKPYGGDNKNWAMFYVPDNKRSDIIKYAKDKGFDKIYWGSDEALGYGLKGGYNGDTLVVFKDANLLPDGYKEDAIKYGELIDENINIANESILKPMSYNPYGEKGIPMFDDGTPELEGTNHIISVNVYSADGGYAVSLCDEINEEDYIQRFNNKEDAIKSAENALNEIISLNHIEKSIMQLGYKNINESKKINESFDKKAILHKIDLFAKQITIDKSNMKDMEELLRSKHIDYQVDADSKPNKVTFYLIYKENINNIKKEAKYNSNISTKDELYTEIQKMLSAGGVDKDSVSLNDLFNCFSMDSLKELYDYISSEYQDDWELDEDEEDLEEATSGIGGAYTTQAIDIQPKAFSKILKTTKENLKFDSQVDYDSLSDYNIEFFENGAGDYKVITPDGDKLDIDIELSDDDKYFVSLPSEDIRSVNRDLTTAIIDVVNKLNNFPINEDINEMENDPSTYIDSSGKTRKNWSIYADYEFKIGKEPTISGLLEISKDLDSTKYLSNKDKKELKDYINSRCKTLKTEAVTKFYGKDFDDDVIKDKIEFTKAHPQEFMALKYLDTFEYEGVTYYVASEDKRITYDEKECVVYLVYDENLNKYLAYFEVTLNDAGDAENGPDLQMEISEVPYKIVAI